MVAISAPGWQLHGTSSRQLGERGFLTHQIPSTSQCGGNDPEIHLPTVNWISQLIGMGDVWLDFPDAWYNT